MSPRGRSGDVLTGCAAVAAASGLLFAEEASARVAPPTLGLMQYLVATPVALLVALHARRGGERMPSGVRLRLGIAAHALLIAAALLAEFAALRVAAATTVSFVGRVEIILTVALGALVLQERLRPVEIVGGALAFVGVFVLRWDAPPEIGRGALLALLGAVFFAAGEVVAKRVVRDVPSRTFLGARSVVVLGAFALAHLAWPGLSGPASLRNVEPSTWALALGLAACGPLLARGLYLEALRRIPLSRAALIMQGQPILIVAAALVAGATLRPLELVGGSIVLLGTIVVIVARADPSRGVRG